MLSILIPVYQFDVRQMVQELLQQGRQLGILFEIRVYDDASPGDLHLQNRELESEPEVTYRELPRNIGRSLIRNLLAQEAKFEYLLFLDGDSAIIRTDFLQKYLQAADPGTVLHGGTAYAPNPPNPDAYLRWYYGHQREVRKPEQRTANGYHSFTSNNFICPSSIFRQIQFDESLTGYGHEDTLFGFALEQASIPINYIDNPLQHIGLESGIVFLRKTREGVNNLRYLYELGKPVQARLLDLYLRVKKWGISSWIGRIGIWITPWMERQLLSKRPQLWVFDLYKLVVICEVRKDKKSPPSAQ